MANITRFDPFNELTRLDPLSDFDNLFKGFMVRPVFQGATAAPQMKLEVSEDDKAYTVRLRAASRSTRRWSRGPRKPNTRMASLKQCCPRSRARRRPASPSPELAAPAPRARCGHREWR